ncbi:hypothetical protein [Fluviicola taffensis]|uniref:Uncharacterized protein n=1 Tax=Fluviicola taffensis (strain DSM 16823 / NCIMB 13979 / RW262) TaxID=755732 RepID=F2ICK0_FLUTR|nr:hypothetical protein [Fluviicola taffensis]AEA45470.1 hypothetical protein Fluta_3499 [Fluviicola taffensis DSM 16823]
MKITLILFFLFSWNLFSQDSIVVVSNSSHNFLYARVPNLIKIGFSKMDEPYYLNCNCEKITNMDSLGNLLPPHNFIVLPSNNLRTFIEIYNTSNQDTVLISEIEFYNIPLPDPGLYFGATDPEGFVYWKETRLFLKSNFYPINENYEYRILDWKVKIGNKEYSGNGNELTSEVQIQIKKLKENHKIEIEVRCTADDKKERIIRTFFRRAPDSWYSHPEEIPDEDGNYLRN